MMDRESVYELLIALKAAQRHMSYNESLAIVRTAVATGRQHPFIYDVLACLEECEDADYDTMKTLLGCAVRFVNSGLANPREI